MFKNPPLVQINRKPKTENQKPEKVLDTQGEWD